MSIRGRRNKEYVFIQVARGIDNHKLKGILLILNLDGVSHTARVAAPGNNEAKSYLFDVGSYAEAGELQSVTAKVAPIYIINKQERIGQTTSEVDVEKKSITTEAQNEISDGNITIFELELPEEVEELIDIQGENCGQGEYTDLWDGCAEGRGWLSSVESALGGKKAYIQEDAMLDWANQEVKFYHYGDVDSQCVNTAGKCLTIGTPGNDGTWYLPVTDSGNVLNVSTGCQNDMYFIYNSGDCVETL